MELKPRILLIPSHHGFYRNEEKSILELGIPFTLDMLQWPIYLHKTLIDDACTKMYRSAFESILQMDPCFTAVISIFADLELNQLKLMKRDWGQIYYEGKLVSRFSHDTRKTNSPFYRLIEWPEVDEAATVISWSEFDWKRFFMSRINRNMEKLLSESIEKINAASADVRLACDALGSL